MKEEHDDLARSNHRPLPGFDDNPLRNDSLELDDLELDGLELDDDLELDHSLELDDSLEPVTATQRKSGAASADERSRSYFGVFDEDEGDDYEESDRDTDFALGFREEAVEEEDEDGAFETLLPEEFQEDTLALFEEQEAFLANEVEAAFQSAQLNEEEWETRPVPNAADATNEWDEDESDSTSWQSVGATTAALSQGWSEEEYAEDDVEHEPSPVVPLLVGAVALLLIIAGVYGVVQQRMETQEQIRQLQASLATTASPEELAASRAALQDAKERNTQLSFQVTSLRQDNQRLADTVSELEAQMQAQEAAALKAAVPVKAAPVKAAPVKAAPPKAATPKPTAPKAAATTAAVATGAWFVNFGSYGNEAVAQEWASRLRPAAGEVIVAPSVKDGRTFYRVRVIGLGSQEAAQQTAQQLQSTYGLPKLWIGQQ